MGQYIDLDLDLLSQKLQPSPFSTSFMEVFKVQHKRDEKKYKPLEFPEAMIPTEPSENILNKTEIYMSKKSFKS